MNTPKVKMPLTQAQLKQVFGIPADVEVINMWVNHDPLMVTIILASNSEFDALYAPYGGFEPTISYETILPDFFTAPPA